MPKLPKYARQGFAAVPGRMSPPGGGEITGVVSAGYGALAKIKFDKERKAQQLQAIISFNQKKQGLSKSVDQTENDIAPDGSGHVDNIKGDLNVFKQDLDSEIEGENLSSFQQGLVNHQYSQLEALTVDKAIHKQRVQAGKHAAYVVEESIKQWHNETRANPTLNQLAYTLGESTLTIGSMTEISRQAQLDLDQAVRQKVHAAYGEGIVYDQFLIKDPLSVKAIMDKIEWLQNNDMLKRELTPAKYDELMGALTSQLGRAKTRKVKMDMHMAREYLNSVLAGKPTNHKEMNQYLGMIKRAKAANGISVKEYNALVDLAGGAVMAAPELAKIPSANMATLIRMQNPAYIKELRKHFPHSSANEITKMAAAVAKAAKNEMDAREKDPAGHAALTHPKVADAYRLFALNPNAANAQRYAEESARVQGIWDRDKIPKILPTAEKEEVAALVNNMDRNPNGTAPVDFLQHMRGLEARYGDMAPKVLNNLFADGTLKGHHYLAAVMNKVDETMAREFLLANEMDSKVLNDDYDADTGVWTSLFGTTAKEVRGNVMQDEEIRNFLATFNAADPQFKNKLRSGMIGGLTKFAKYAKKMGFEPDMYDKVKNAIISNRFAIPTSMSWWRRASFMPDEINVRIPSDKGYDIPKIMGNMYATKSNLTRAIRAGGIGIPPSRFIINPNSQYNRELYARSFYKNGKAETINDEYFGFTDGRNNWLHDLNGDRIEIPYKMLESGPMDLQHPFMGSGILPSHVEHTEAIKKAMQSVY